MKQLGWIGPPRLACEIVHFVLIGVVLVQQSLDLGARVPVKVLWITVTNVRQEG